MPSFWMSPSTTKTSPFTTLPLVWVTTGKTQHAAYLIDEDRQSGRCLIQWASTQEMEHVRTDRVEKSLSPRRRKSPDRLTLPDNEQPISNTKKTRIDPTSHLEVGRPQLQAKHTTTQQRFSLTRRASTRVKIGSMQKKKVKSTSFYSTRDDNTNAASADYLVAKPMELDDTTCGASGPQHQTPLRNEQQKENSSIAPVGENTAESDTSIEIVENTTAGTTAMTDNSLHPSSISIEGTPSPNKCQDNQMSNDLSSLLQTVDLDPEKASAPSDSESLSGFPLASSAYLQNLAEIANIITNDGRWRVGGRSTEPLLRWEDGVDLSAITYLSRLYIPPRRYTQKNHQCACLLCHDNQDNTTKVICSDGTVDTTKRITKNEEVYQPLTTTDEDIRWLYIYCRLFYRRGPWFRLDDVYERYYKPGKRGEPLEVDQDGETDSNTTRSACLKENQGPVMTNTSDSRPIARNHIALDINLLEKHLRCLADLVRDLSRLVKTGMVRAFDDEEECGKTVGVSLLTTDMRAIILAKLGGGRKKPPTPLNPNTNAIYCQMKQQTSILSSFNGLKSKLLPVRKHVDDVVVDCLIVNSILKPACGIDTSSYLPSSLYKEHAPNLRNHVRNLLCHHGLSNYSCFRLREKPYLGLLRCCRLFLCATSGPGDMRSNESNGWKSLLPTSGTPPLHKRLRRPGLDTWCFVSYPGSLTRFGRTTCFFTRAYNLVDPTQPDAVGKQIFLSRKRFLAWESAVELRAHVDYLLELTELYRYETRKSERDSHEPDGRRAKVKLHGDSVDYLNLFTQKGRINLVKDYVETDSQISSVCDTMSTLLQTSIKSDMLEWERLLIIVAALCISILMERHKTIKENEITWLEAMPWLRHLWYEGCIAYLLWDLIPILERLDLYDTAVVALRLLISGQVATDFSLYDVDTTRLAPLLLSRRARGKAYDRLIIDLDHLARKENIGKENQEKKLATKLRAENKSDFCERVLTSVAPTASVPFSAIRTLARRLKKPLKETLHERPSLEMEELKLRVCKSCGCNDKGYSDWTPLTDLAVANNTLGPGATVGSRCVFVGHEDGSLNVEELAMECYRSGKLPARDHSQQSNFAGWEGWHDEGGTIRAIFRIICGPVLLGMDWGCDHPDSFPPDQDMIHISPHQGAPFDLHVGFELSRMQDKQTGPLRETRSFYARRRHHIERFLDKISALGRQEISNLVYDSVQARLAFTVENGGKDPSLDRDLKNVRTLSLVAAGCGGEQLSAIFRCLLYDYRHWSGGFPDLLLVRAIANDSDGIPSGLVDLSKYVGESFSPEFQVEMKNQLGAAMLADEEFLACSKVGDSGGTQFRSSRRVLQQSRAASTKSHSMDDLPEKLQLTFEGMCVIPECMMVEVKSSNDRLDPRQEDWLNVLDRYGDARVCKFEDSKKYTRRLEKEAKAATSTK